MSDKSWCINMYTNNRSMRGQERILWVVLVFLLLVGLFSSVFYLEGSIDELKKENQELEIHNINLRDTNWNLQFELQNQKDTP